MPHTKNTSVICCRILLLERVEFEKKNEIKFAGLVRLLKKMFRQLGERLRQRQDDSGKITI